MRIALVSREYPPETGRGGIGTYVHHLSHALAGAGHDVQVISRARMLPERVDTDSGVTVHRVIERRHQGRGWWRVYRALPLIDYGYARRVDAKVRELHRQRPFDVIEAPDYGAEAFFLTRSPVAPVIVKLHTPTLIVDRANQAPPSMRSRLLNLMEASACRRAQGISSPSRDLADQVAAAWRLDRGAIHVLAYPVEVERWPAQPHSDGEPVLLFVGRLEVRKGIAVLGAAWPQVAAQVPQARFVVVGNVDDSPLRAPLSERWRREGCLDRVTWIPWQSPAGLQERYRHARVVVLPSLYENFPNVCLEAMASGRAVVASAVGGLPELVTEGVTGALVPPGDPNRLAQVLVELLQDRERCRRLGDAARTRLLEAYASPVIACETLAWYARVRSRWDGQAGVPCGPGSAAERPLRLAYVMADPWVDLTKAEGAPIQLRAMREGLAKRGHAVIQVALPPAAPRRWAQRRLGGDVADVLNGLGEIGGTWTRAFIVLRRLWKAGPVDLIHDRYALYGLAGWLASHVLQRPLVLNVDAPLIEEVERLHGVRLGRLRRTWANTVLRLNVTRARAIQVPSEELAAYLSGSWRVPRAKIVVVHNGVDPALFESPAGVQADEPVVIFVGSLQPWHGCDVLLAAFATVRREIPDARLVLLGDGKMRGALEAQAASLGLDGGVEFAGQVPHDAVPRRLRQAAVAVAPYPKLPVAFYFSPMKLFEYMAAGKAVVASRLGQITQVITDRETGWLIEPSSVEELSASLLRLLRDGSLRARLGAAAKEAVRPFTWERQARALEALYRRVIEQEATAHG